MSINRTRERLEVDGEDLKLMDKVLEAALDCLHQITKNGGGISTAAAAILIIKAIGQIG